jgi:hypothetical protein
MNFGAAPATMTDEIIRGERSSGVSPTWLIVCAFLIGCCLRLPIAVPQAATEGALVLAGIVPYPSSSLMNYYFLGTWTSLHQTAALLLLAGVGQSIVDYLLCIVPAGLLLSASTMVLYGFTRRPIFSLATAILCFSTMVFATWFNSTDYPLLGAVWSSSREHTFGIWGAVAAAWFFGALMGGWNTTAGFTATALISIHPVIGVYVSGIALCVICAGYLMPTIFRIAGLGRGLILGGALSAVSFAAYLATRPHAPSDFDAGAFATYLEVWDYHRSLKIGYGSVETLMRPHLALAAGLGLFLIASRGRSSPADTGALALLGTIVGAIILYIFDHLGSPPQFFVNAIPGRLLNIHAYLAGAIIVALLAWFVSRLVAALAGEVAALRGRPANALSHRTSLMAGALFALSALFLAVRIGFWQSIEKFVPSASELAATGQALQFLSSEADETFWRRVREIAPKGLVLPCRAASFDALTKGHLAIGFDPNGFDFVPYLPSTAPDVRRFVETGYGVSFSDPPQDLRSKGSLPSGIERDYWSRMTLDQWRDVGRKLGIVGVVAPSDWRLAWSPEVSGPKFNLYVIPAF